MRLRYKSFECVDELLKFVNPNYSCNYVGGTPLAYAIRAGIPQMVEMLLEKGARVEGITQRLGEVVA